MGLGDEDKDFLRQLDWIYPADYMAKLRQLSEALIEEQLAIGERQNIREIVGTIMTRLQLEAEGTIETEADADAAAAQAAAGELVRQKVLAALHDGQPDIPAGMGPEAVAALVGFLDHGELIVADNARQALRCLTDGGAIDALCQLWANTRRPELEHILVAAGYLASQPLGLRLLTVLKTGADRVMLNEGPALIPELLRVVDDADRSIAGRARRLLLTLTNRQAIDALCETVLAIGEEQLTNWAVIARYAPTIDSKAALYYCITGQWDKYFALDWQETRPLLKKGYSQAVSEQRQQFLTAARQSGHSLLLVGLLLEGGQQEEYEEITDEDWAAMLDLLTSQEQWSELYRLALCAPANWAAEFVLALGNTTWKPKSWESSDWENSLACCPQTGRNMFVPDGRLLAVLEANQAEVNVECAAFHPNGRIVAGGCADGRVRLWQITSGKLWRTVNLHDEGITAVAFTPDGRYLVTAGRDALVHIWQLPAVKWVDSIKGQPGFVMALAAGQGGEMLALACPGGVLPARAWWWDGSYMTTKAQYPGSLFSAASVALEKRAVAGGGRDGRIRIYTLAGGSGGNKLWAAHNGPVQGLLYSGDGRLLVSNGMDGTIKVWQTDNGKQLWSIKEQGKLLAVSQSGAFIILKSAQGTVAVRQLRLKKPLALATHGDWHYMAAMLASPELETPARQAGSFLHSLLTAKFRYDIML
ncbi:WD40 repeat domain-containing protein [Sporomusa sp. KB1]|jgi:WD40 repeat protein|uniref:WD40 repeat domain-containing protein n=1 Tax=Sporomusa sp. KB1 TaxID=943346 RepID=UPI00119FD174|nr:WD40 repeat domain-containing protein [Sporomusa sp. KB1]TWH46734.1 FOG: WD40 repeat [Sporomusa sp. KB1]